jgi:hypothetical protein
LNARGQLEQLANLGLFVDPQQPCAHPLVAHVALPVRPGNRSTHGNSGDT